MAREYYEPKNHTTSSALSTEIGEAAGGTVRGALRGVAAGILLMGAAGAGLAVWAGIAASASVAGLVGIGVLGAIGGVLLGGVTVPILGAALGAIFGATAGAERGHYRVQAEGLEARRQMAHDQELSAYRDISVARATEAQATAAQMQMALQMQGQQAAVAPTQARIREQSVEQPSMVAANDNPQTKIDAATIDASRMQAATAERSV